MTTEDKINWATRAAETKGATFVHAIFRSLGIVQNVEIKVPGITDPHFKKVSSHTIMVPREKDLKEFDLFEIAGRDEGNQQTFRRGDWIQKQLLTRRFNILPESLGSRIVAEVEVMEKTDLFRDEKKSLIIVIRQLIPNGQPLVARHALKIGVDCKKVENEFLIPETDKAIRFEKKIKV